MIPAETTRLLDEVEIRVTEQLKDRLVRPIEGVYPQEWRGFEALNPNGTIARVVNDDTDILVLHLTAMSVELARGPASRTCQPTRSSQPSRPHRKRPCHDPVR